MYVWKFMDNKFNKTEKSIEAMKCNAFKCTRKLLTL